MEKLCPILSKIDDEGALVMIECRDGGCELWHEGYESCVFRVIADHLKTLTILSG